MQRNPPTVHRPASTAPAWVSVYLPNMPLPEVPPPAAQETITPREMPQGNVFRLVRDISGIIGYETEPTRGPRTTVLGPAADQYFWAHGYLPGTVNLIQRSYARSTGREDFVEELKQSGVPVTEAIYMYTLISQGEEL